MTFEELGKKLSPEGRLKTYNQELSVYINKHVKGKTVFVITEFVQLGKGARHNFAHVGVTKEEYIEYLKEEFKNEKDDRILNHGC
jgi:phosphoribosylpyrophosphate synthetase